MTTSMKRKYKWEIEGIQWLKHKSWYWSFFPREMYSIERSGPREWNAYLGDGPARTLLAGPFHSAAQAMLVCEIHLAESEMYPW